MNNVGHNVTKRLDCYTFGRSLVQTGDLDPVYILVWQADLPTVQLQRWLLAYWCFYHVGTACWITGDNGTEADYWERMQAAAASKEYPRCPERRHFRGQQAANSVAYLKKRGCGPLFKDLLSAGSNAVDKIEAAKSWLGFGEWISFKVADMLERLDICPVVFDLATAMYDSPTKGAQLLWNVEKAGVEGKPALASEYAVERILWELADLKAPPRYERPLNVQEAETVCCKWKSHYEGRYHVGEDVEACLRALGWASRNRCRLSQQLYKAGKKGGLW